MINFDINGNLTVSGTFVQMFSDVLLQNRHCGNKSKKGRTEFAPAGNTAALTD